MLDSSAGSRDGVPSDDGIGGVHSAGRLPGSLHSRAPSNYSHMQKNIILVIRKIVKLYVIIKIIFFVKLIVTWK